MRELGPAIEDIQSATSAEDVYARYLKIVNAYGYDRMTYSLMTDFPALNLKRQHGLITNYPASWMQHYIQNDYLAIDPVVIAAKQSSVPFFWADIKSRLQLPGKSWQVLEEGAESGVRDGICISFYGQGGELSGVGLARTDGGPHADKDYALMADLNLISAFFHQKLMSYLSLRQGLAVTHKERDILNWAAEGKTDEEISLLLHLSVNTVRWHWKKLFEKLEVRGRVNCVTKAMMMGIIVPAQVRSHYQKW